MKRKRILAVLLVLCLLCLLPPVRVCAAKPALPRSVGIAALRGQFETGVAPQAGRYALDYAYYSPATENDSTKYPLVIFLHGIGHGDFVGSQLADSDMPYWSSAELQARFKDAGGGYILLPRAPEEKGVYWGELLLEPLRALIDDFIQKNPNVDTTRICIGGSSAGGSMVWKMLVAFPEYFATALPLASTETPSAADVKAAAGTAVWMFASSKDPVVNYTLSTLPTWNTLCRTNRRPTSCRLTVFGDVFNPDGLPASDNHHLAKVVTNDMFTLNDWQYPNAQTQNGIGQIVRLIAPNNGIIAWISSIRSSYEGQSAEGTGNIELSIFDSLFDRIQNLFLRLVNLVQRLLGL